MTLRPSPIIAAALAAALLAAPQALAQKSKDTLRVAFSTKVPLLSIYTFAQPHADFFYRELYDNLLQYDEVGKRFIPRLATSYRRVGPKTIEFTLRDDIVFHNGKKMDADDAVYTLNWTVDPKSKIFIKNRYTGVIESAEKTGPYKFLLHTKAPTAIDMLRLRSFFVYDSELHKSLKDPGEYGKLGIGTGPMRLASFKPGQRIVLERFDGFRLGAPNPIGRVEGLIMPDAQTRIAQLLTGGVDVIRDPTPDQMKNLSQRPGLTGTIGGGGNLPYFRLDAVNRSGKVPALTDIRVRRAIFMAIDRQALAETRAYPGQKVKLADGMCLEEMIACGSTTKPPPYDLAGAKRLLAEAGHAGGFPLEIMTTSERNLAELVSGQLRRVGIEATIRQVTNFAIRKLLADGQMQAEVGSSTGLALPDAHFTFQVYYARKATDYSNDPVITRLGREGLTTRDQDRRRQIYSDMFDRINQEAYQMPFAPTPVTYIHTTDVVYNQTPMVAITPRVTDFHWAK